MSTTTNLLESTLRTGAAASVATALTAALFGQAEKGKPLAPINAVSHIAFGSEAAEHNEPSCKYTATGLLLHTAAVTMWSAVYEAIHERREKPNDLAGALVDGAIVSGLAYITDYFLVPKRLTPGFELRLSNSSLAGIFGMLALSLAVGSLATKKE
jgi:hypothetical protein